MSAIVQFPTPTTFRNLATPTDNTDGATKAYVDGAISGGSATANTIFVGSTAPANAIAGYYWLDSDYGILSINCGDVSNTVWISVSY
jgi:hypothetical protein